MSDSYWEDQFEGLRKSRTRWIQLNREKGAALRAEQRHRWQAEQRALAAEARVAELEREVAYVRGALEEELGRNLVNQIELVHEAPFTFAQRTPGKWQ